jgi:hypothetical protein
MTVFSIKSEKAARDNDDDVFEFPSQKRSFTKTGSGQHTPVGPKGEKRSKPDGFRT